MDTYDDGELRELLHRKGRKKNEGTSEAKSSVISDPSAFRRRLMFSLRLISILRLNYIDKLRLST